MKKILKPVASLTLTVILLVLTMILILVGTSAQKETGIWEVQHWYFHSFFCWIEPKHFLPLWDWWWQHAPSLKFHLPNPFGKPIAVKGIPFPGGYTLIILLLCNLLSAHAVRFKLSWKRVGIIMIHLGLILLLVGEVVTSLIAVESEMSLVDGESARFTSDVREAELAVIDTTPSDHDTATVIAERRLAAGGTIHDSRLPFDVRIDDYYSNADVLGPMQAQHLGLKPDARVDHGTNTRLVVQRRDPFSGVGDEAEKVNMPAAYVTPVADGKPLGTFLLCTTPTGMGTDRAQTFDVTDSSNAVRHYAIQLRFKRLYKPYSIKLIKFTHENYIGTDLPRSFASRVELIDPERGVDREVVISMNHPLRFRNETIYQAKTTGLSDGGEGTVLQVVENPNWFMPYLSVLIGGIGLVVHFVMTLVRFLIRMSKDSASNVPFARPVKRHGLSSSGQYSLQPRAWGGMSAALGCLVTLAIVGTACALALSPQTNAGLNMSEFGQIPVYEQGRAQPLDSLARVSLKIINGTETLSLESPDGSSSGKSITAIQWFADMMARPDVADDYKVFRIDNPDIKGMLGLKDSQKRFSFNELFPLDQDMAQDNGKKIEDQYRKAVKMPEKERGAYETKIIELLEHARLYVRLARIGDYRELFALIQDPAKANKWAADVESINKLNPGQRNAEQSRLARREEMIQRALNDLDLPGKLASQGNKDEAREAERQRQLLDVYFAAPLERNADPTKQENWIGLGKSVINLRTSQPVAGTASAFFGLLNDYHDQQAQTFNADLSNYQIVLRHSVPGDMAKAGLEAFFNRFDPFLLCEIFYVTIFVLVCIYWLSRARWLAMLALAIGGVTVLLHGTGLLLRILISGRPPVTNLYSSAIFIGFGAVLLCLALGVVLRLVLGRRGEPIIGLAAALAAVAGFLPLLIAGALATRDPDTMEQLRAVLDTNFWLATHVVCVTLGYATTYLAGLIAMGFVVASLVTAPSGGVDKETRKVFLWMTYGVICFALLFSFVGTILGGIWADQSWGRFWGWDPKENGAALIVLWNAVILHARWGGLVREKGVMLLAIFGNIVVSWSWFGTNMLGIGLHAYGFMGQQLLWLTIAVLGFLAFIAVGAFLPSKSANSGGN